MTQHPPPVDSIAPITFEQGDEKRELRICSINAGGYPTVQHVAATPANLLAAGFTSNAECARVLNDLQQSHVREISAVRGELERARAENTHLRFCAEYAQHFVNIINRVGHRVDERDRRVAARDLLQGFLSRVSPPLTTGTPGPEQPVFELDQQSTPVSESAKVAEGDERYTPPCETGGCSRPGSKHLCWQCLGDLTRTRDRPEAQLRDLTAKFEAFDQWLSDAHDKHGDSIYVHAIRAKLLRLRSQPSPTRETKNSNPSVGSTREDEQCNRHVNDPAVTVSGGGVGKDRDATSSTDGLGATLGGQVGSAYEAKPTERCRATSKNNAGSVVQCVHPRNHLGIHEGLGKAWPNQAEDYVDPLHPTGRCTCGGEGRCDWCKANPDPYAAEHVYSFGRPRPDHADRPGVYVAKQSPQPAQKAAFAVGQRVKWRARPLHTGEVLVVGFERIQVKTLDGLTHTVPPDVLEPADPAPPSPVELPGYMGPVEALRGDIVAALRRLQSSNVFEDQVRNAFRWLADELAKSKEGSE